MESKILPEVDMIISLPASFDESLFGTDAGETPFMVFEATDGNPVIIITQSRPLPAGGLDQIFDEFKEFREQGGDFTVGAPESGQGFLSSETLRASFSGTLDGDDILGEVAIIEGLDDLVGVIHIYTAADIWDPAGIHLFQTILDTLAIADVQ